MLRVIASGAGLLPLALVLAACGGGPASDGAGPPAAPPPPPDPGTLYEANAVVLDDGTRGPMLCLGAVLESLPPQCGDVPLEGWDWDAVEGQESVGGTTWGSYRVVGTYDGETFMVREVGAYVAEPPAGETEPDLSSPCPEPDGGWEELEGATQLEAGAPQEYAMAQPDYVSSWVTQLEPREREAGPVIFNAIFTGDAERHEAELRKVWEGPLCVLERDVPSAAELERVRREIESSLDELGLQMLWSSGPSVEPVVELGVVADPDGRAQAALDERYGEGVVRLRPAFQPVS